MDELLKLLGHSHGGVRVEAQFALAAKGKDAIPPLMNLARDPKVERLVRVHALWALGMITRNWNAGRKVDHDLTQVLADCEIFFKDSDPEVRAQAARLVSDPMLPVTRERPLQELLSDPEPRVRLFAALALARISKPLPKGYLDGLPPAEANALFQQKRYLRNSLLNMVWKNGGTDPYLRYAGACALASGVPTPVLLEMKDDKSAEVRLALTIALRRQKAPEVATFLADSDPKVIAEAARAINDEVITPALPKLAELLSRPQLPPVVAFRALNAHFLLGKAENARALAQYAGRSDARETLRALAVRMLGDWAKPPRRDYITGLTQDLPPRPREDAVGALVPPKVLGLVARSPKAVRTEFVAAARKLDLKEAGPVLADLVADAKEEPEVRVEALNTLASLKDARIGEAAKKATAANDGRVRNAGRAVLFRTDPEGVLRQLRDALAGTDVAERQGAFALLAENPSAGSDALIEEWLDKVAAKSAPPELWLDVLEAAGKSKSERIKRRLAGYENARPKDDLGKYREALAGGDAARGRDILLHKEAVECQRCHKLDGEGGEVGPPLNGVGKQTREYLLESIVLPSKAIAKGYESVLITTVDGKTVSGVLKSEDNKDVHLMTAEGKLVTVKKDEIDDRRATKSAMPEDLPTKLTKRELRDLVEFLSGLKDEWKK
jgi:quinoprotein glucose dehydrogenase